MSDLVSTAFARVHDDRVLVSPDGAFEYVAAHAQSPAHYYAT
jgi:hypothetical protein